MQSYLDAHTAFVNWLNGAAECEPTAEQVEKPCSIWPPAPPAAA